VSPALLAVFFASPHLPQIFHKVLENIFSGDGEIHHLKLNLILIILIKSNGYVGFKEKPEPVLL